VQTLTFTSSVVSAHSHTFSMTTAEVDTPPTGGITRDTSIAQAHFHVVTLTEADLDSIAAGNTVEKTTSLAAGHDHVFSFSRAP